MHGKIKILKNDDTPYKILDGDKIDLLLISDGIKLNKNILNYDIKIQRILTPYQLLRTVSVSAYGNYYIIIESKIFDSWKLMIIQEIYNIIKMRAYYHNSNIIFHIYENRTVNENFIGD